MKSRLLLSSGLFIGSVVVAAFLSVFVPDTSNPISLAIIVAAAVLGVVVVMGPTYFAGKVDYGADRKTTEWTLHSYEPFRTYMPTNVTDATSNTEAKRLCDEGRKIIQSKDKNASPDLDRAFKLFSLASRLDDDYWEPQANMANIKLIKGELKEAHNLASEVRTKYYDNSLAVCRANLIIAKALEATIDRSKSNGTTKKQYRRIVTLLRDSLPRCSENLTMRNFLGQAILMGGGSKEEFSGFFCRKLKGRELQDRVSESVNPGEHDGDFAQRFS